MAENIFFPEITAEETQAGAENAFTAEFNDAFVSDDAQEAAISMKIASTYAKFDLEEVV